VLKTIQVGTEGERKKQGTRVERSGRRNTPRQKGEEGGLAEQGKLGMLKKKEMSCR